MWVCVVESGCSLQFYSLLASCYAFLLCILLSLLTIHLLVLRCNTSLEVRNSQTKPMKRRIFKRQVLKLVRSLDSWSKSCEFESRQERRESFLLQGQLCVLTLIRCPFHPRVTTVTRKRLRSFCQKCRWQVTPKHAYTLYSSKSEWADYAAVQAECGNLSGNELTRNSSGNTRSQSSQLAELLWNDPVLKSEISLRELILLIYLFIYVFIYLFLARRRGMICRTFSQNPVSQGKIHQLWN